MLKNSDFTAIFLVFPQAFYFQTILLSYFFFKNHLKLDFVYSLYNMINCEDLNYPKILIKCRLFNQNF